MAFLFTLVSKTEYSRLPNDAAGPHWVIRQVKKSSLVVVLIVMKFLSHFCFLPACEDILEDCSSYVNDPNQCQSSPFFTKYCKRTCNICGT